MFLILFIPLVGCCQVYDSLLIKLNDVLDHKKEYDDAKTDRIKKLKYQVNSTDRRDYEKHYTLYLKLYNEYKTFDHNEALAYAHLLQKTAKTLNDPVKIAYSKINLGFILLSSGMFKETFDTLKTVNIKPLPDSIRKEYYFLNARTYYDVGDFDQDDYYTSEYNGLAKKYIDSADKLCNANSFDYIYYNGLRFLKNGDQNTAIINLKLLLSSCFKLTDHQFAVTASTLSDIYIRKNQPDSAITLLIQAAMADVRSSTKEAAAMLNLAQLLHQRGDEKDAYVYIKQAMDDAIYYHAKQRQIQVSAILPLIATERINNEQGQKRVLFFYASLLTLLSILVVVFATIIYKQLKRLKIADKLILKSNEHLQSMINQLNEAEKIKEEYIGYYFNMITEYITKLEKFKRSVDHKLITKRYDDIHILVNNINLVKEREDLFINFDKAFLKLFPNFVDDFNDLFTEENKIKLSRNQLLNTDLRIFALIRLGIADTEKIANILEYSVNTIYNYKARIKGRSKISNDDFEDAIKAIKAF